MDDRDRAYEIPTVDRLLATLNQGDDAADATRDYRQLMQVLPARVAQHGGKHKGRLVLMIDFIADAKGMDVSLSSECKLPKRPVQKERYFVTDRNTLTAKDPARGSLFEGQDLGRRQRGETV